MLQDENSDIEQPEIGEVVAKTAVRTVLSAFVCIVLLAALFTTFFPYAAMNLYNDLGNKNRALECAARFVSRERGKYDDAEPPLDSKYVRALYMASNIAVSLYNEADAPAEKKERAESVIAFTDEYLAVPRIAERNNLLDEYNVKQGGQPYYYHPSLYSYRDYLVRYNYLARIELGERDSWIYAGEQSTLAMFANMFYNVDFAPSESTIVDMCEGFNMLSAMIVYDFKRAGLNDFIGLTENELASIAAIRDSTEVGWFSPLVERSGKTMLLTNIEMRFEQVKSYAIGMRVTDADSALKQLYVFRSLASFAYNTRAMLIALSSNSFYGGIDINASFFWRDAVGGIPYEGSNCDMNFYYNEVLLARYPSYLTAA